MWLRFIMTVTMIVILRQNCSFCVGVDWARPFDDNEGKVHGRSYKNALQPLPQLSAPSEVLG